MNPEHAAKRLEEFREAMDHDMKRFHSRLDRRCQEMSDVEQRRFEQLRDELKVTTDMELDRLNRIIKGEPPPDACPLCKQPLACGWWCCGCKATKDRVKLWASLEEDQSLGTLAHTLIVFAIVAVIVGIVCFF